MLSLLFKTKNRSDGSMTVSMRQRREIHVNTMFRVLFKQKVSI